MMRPRRMRPRAICPLRKLAEVPSAASTIFDIDKEHSERTTFTSRGSVTSVCYTTEKHEDENGRNKLVIRRTSGVLATIQQRGVLPDEITFEGERPMWLRKWLKWSWRKSFPVTFEYRGITYAWNSLSGNRLILSALTAPDTPTVAWFVPSYLDQHRKTLYPAYLALAPDAEVLREHILISSVLVVQWMQARVHVVRRMISISYQTRPAPVSVVLCDLSEDVITSTTITQPVTDARYTFDELGKNLVVFREASLAMATIRRSNMFPDEITFAGKQPMWLWRWLKWSLKGSFPVTFAHDGTTYAWNRTAGNCITLSKGTTTSTLAIARFKPFHSGCVIHEPSPHQTEIFLPGTIRLSPEADTDVLREYVLISCVLIVQRMRELARNEAQSRPRAPAKKVKAARSSKGALGARSGKGVATFKQLMGLET